MADTNKETLVEKLTDIADGFRTSRSLTESLSLDEMAVLAAVPIGIGAENKLVPFLDGSLTQLTAEDLAGLTSIKNYACYHATNLETVEFPNTLKTIGHDSFNQCTNLTSINLPEGLETILNNAFYRTGLSGSIVLPNTLTHFGSNVFAYTKISSVVIGEGLTALPNNAFYECRSLRTITIPNTITTIGSQGFAFCNISTITLPASITSLGNSCFYNCWNLKTVTLLSTTPPTIGTNFFSYASGLNKIIVPAGSGEAYKTATNWAEWADYIEEASV